MTFIPHPWLFNGQLQTILGHLLSRPPRVANFSTETVDLGDNDRINLHIDLPQENTAHKKHLMVLLHGLGGCSESDYILRIGSKLNALGYPVVRFNHRGCGVGGALLAREIYHAGRTHDIERAVSHLIEAWPGYKISIAAFSLSANMLLKFLAKYRDQQSTKAIRHAVSVCPPIDLEQCSLAISNKKNLHLDRYYTWRLIRTAREKKRLFPETPHIRFPLSTNLRLFDEIYTARLAGFKSRDHYYGENSSINDLNGIQVGTTLIYAKDDPIIPDHSFQTTRLSSAINIVSAISGGHMGFVAAKPTRWGDPWWMDEAVIDPLIVNE